MFNLKKTLAMTAAALAVGGFAVSAQAANDFANGGFEIAGTTTPADSWLAAASGYTRSTDAHSGMYSAQLNSPALNSAVFLQNSQKDGGLGPLTAGDTPTLTFWAKGYQGETGDATFSLRYLDGIGNILKNSLTQHFNSILSTTSWNQVTYSLGAVPVGATAAFIEFSQGIGPVGLDPVSGHVFAGGTVLIDDVNLSSVAAAVPEPESYALMLAGMAVVGGTVRRRRRSA